MRRAYTIMLVCCMVSPSTLGSIGITNLLEEENTTSTKHAIATKDNRSTKPTDNYNIKPTTIQIHKHTTTSDDTGSTQYHNMNTQKNEEEIASDSTEDVTNHFVTDAYLQRKLASFQWFTEVKEEKIVRTNGKSGCTCREIKNQGVTCTGTHCISIPTQIKTNETSLTIDSTSIQTIQKGTFKNYNYLTELTISNNLQLTRIGQDSFAELTHLQTLRLINNTYLSELHQNAFSNLSNLTQIDLVKTSLNLSTITVAIAELPQVGKVILDNNSFQQIYPIDFQPLQNQSSIKCLCMWLCQIEYIHPKALNVLKNLTGLHLSSNRFNSSVFADLLNEMVDNQIPLVELELFEAGFRKNPPIDVQTAIKRSNITKLNLGGNQFELLNEYSFLELPKIQRLDLSFSPTFEIPYNTFNGFAGLRHLRLNNLKLSYLPDGGLLPQLISLDLSNNNVPSGFFSIATRRFTNMTNLEYLNLGNDPINFIVETGLYGLVNLKALVLNNAGLVQLNAGTFIQLQKLKYLDLQNNPILSHNLTYDSSIFIGLERLEYLFLGGCSMVVLDPHNNPFSVLKSLRYLGLENNRFKTIDAGIFSNLKRLTGVNLSNNLISAWTKRIFANQSLLEMLQLSQNKLTTLSKAMVDDFATTTKLNLSSNQFICECNLAYVIYNMENNTFFLKNTPSPSCTSTSDYSNLTVIQYYDLAVSKNICNFSMTKTIVFYSLLVIFLLCFALAIAVFSYRYRWHIRYWVFLTKTAIVRKGRILQRNRNVSEKSYEFDAFVSYSNKDKEFVDTLVDMLEEQEPFLRLCVYDRDFKIGEVISESVLECVEKSRKTVLVVSNSYIKSHWCRWEAQVAENYRLFFQNDKGELVNDSIVVIKLGQVNKANMTPMLKYLLKTRIYLQWETDEVKQIEFWKKLRNFLYTASPCDCNVNCCQ